MKYSPFVHLRVHTAYSLSEGALKIPQVVKLSQQHGMHAVAMTDTNNMFGALEFSQACSKAGVQPIVGAQVALKINKDATKHPTIVLIAQNETGYKNLLKIMTTLYLEKEKEAADPHVTFEELQDKSDGLLCLSGGVTGPIGQALLNGQKNDAKKLTQKFLDLFQDRFYMELMRHGLESEQKTENDFIELAYDLNIPLVATNEAFFSDADMFEAHDALLCIAEGRYITEEDRRKVTPHHSFKSPEEMIKLFEDLPEAIENTVLISKRCSYMPLPHAPLLPTFPSGTDRSEKDELEHQAREGLKQRLKDSVFPRLGDTVNQEDVRQEYEERLAYELKIINQMGFPGYFLIVADFIQWAKSQNIPVGPGRGSGAGSLVAWALTITDVDPIRFSLIFERFLNPERVSMPDFDVDFCQDRRDEVIEYVKQRYGKDRVAQIITFGKLQARAVLRDVGRVLQMSYGHVDKICKLVPSNPANPCTLAEALEQEPQLKQMRKEEAIVDRLISIALKLEGLYRHTSTHAAGVIIADRPLDELIPLYSDPRSDMPATQFSMKYVEMAGLVKFDFLGLKTLTILETAAKMARDQGKDIEIQKIPLEDEKTFKLLQSVRTMGVFQLEGQGMSDVLRKLKPERFEEIIALVALYRPGPMDDIPRYLACRHGEQAVEYMHESFEPILKETFGVMVYQEQVMQIAQVLSGYSLGGADLLRRAMGKKIKAEMDAQRKIFIEGAEKNEVDGKLANKIFDQVAKFAGYGFNKSHSAPYGLIAYQTAFMKANFPEEFMAATMTYDLQNTDKLAMYRQELQNMGIDLLPPDINKSKALFAVEIDPETGKKSIRYALAAIKNVGEAAMREVEAAVQEKPFESLEDFFSRLSPKVLNKRQMENLICAGAFDNLHKDRHALMESLEGLLKYASTINQEKNSSQVNLFAGEKQRLPMPKLANPTPWKSLEQLQKEAEAIGFYLSAHPLDSYEKALEKLGVMESTKIGSTGESGILLAGIPLSLKQKMSKRGKRFAFAGFSDAHSSFEVVLFEEILGESRELLESGDPVLIYANARYDENGACRLSANRVRSLLDAMENQQETLQIMIENPEAIDTVLSTLNKYRGGRQTISLYLKSPGQKELSILLPGTFKLGEDARETLSTHESVTIKSMH